jgi:hypothetical protein
MKKILLILGIILHSSLAFGWNPFSNPITPPAFPGVESDGSGGLIFRSTSGAIPATGILTEAMHKNYVLNDSLLTAATDVQLLALSYETSFQIRVQVGTYAISLVPPTGEKLMKISTLQTADYEMDFSSDEGDIFLIRRVYLDSESGYVWQVIPAIGTATDGGAS